jgi:outer membrane protein assembly factor BamB
MPWQRSLLAILFVTSVTQAGDWPQWLGPTRDGVSSEIVKPWTEQPKVVWRKPIGEGHSSPVVANGKVYVHAGVKGQAAEVLTAFDAATGAEAWHSSYSRAAFENKFGNGPRGTPSVVSGKIYTFGVTGMLTCFDADGGKQVWQVDTLKEFHAKNLYFGASCSPLVDGTHVVVNVGGKGASIVAFDRDRGAVAWKTLDDPASYSSPVVFGNGMEREIVCLTGEGLVGLRPDDGTVFWQFPMRDKLSESSTTPVRIGDLLLGSSVTFGSVGLRLGSKNGQPTAMEQWKKDALTCYFATPVAVGTEHLYLVTGTIIPPPSATLRCVEASTGKELWSKAKVGRYHATLLRTGDQKLLMLDDNGFLSLLDPNPKEYRELARSKVCGLSWAHPALANGRLYIRDDRELLCLELGVR